ncbi:hypothetical protein [Cellulophaga baltica]|uniref:hypothetical protein n=1 Tax=Cellulophaga baltica TaxID=76594 RepID=UPI002494C791|nr:hypothetical protein [Cellulophaga baltica]
MILFYAYGSGLGHINRIQSYIQDKNIPFSSCIILTNTKHKNFISPAIKTIYQQDSFFKDSLLFRDTLHQLIETYLIKELVVDVFPSGFYGELQYFDDVSLKKTLLARILKAAYFKKQGTPRYDELLVLEKGIDLKHYNYKKVSYAQVQTDLRHSKKEIQIKAPFFYIIHSEPAEEVHQLYKIAKMHQKNGEHIYIQTFCALDDLTNEEGVTVLQNTPPLLSLLEEADKLFTACGFNLFYATEQYRAKQYFMPFKRRYDDQFQRKLLNT